MNNLIQIRISDENPNKETIRTQLIGFYDAIITDLKSSGLFSNDIKGIIISDDYENHIVEQAKEWGQKAKVTKEKEYSGISKILYNHNAQDRQFLIFVDFRIHFNDHFPVKNIVVGMIFQVYARKIIPDSFNEDDLKAPLDTLDSYIIFMVPDWCKTVYSKRLESLHLEPHNHKVSHKSALVRFKRKLKSYLYKYNSEYATHDEQFMDFWHSYYDNLYTLFLRILENPITNESDMIAEGESSKVLIYQIIDEVNNLTNLFVKGESVDFASVKKLIVDFSACFEIHLLENGIKLTQNPKDYFTGELVEVEPRLVCFLDILGFKELIDEYDADFSSTVLQDIQESFYLAKKSLLENNISLQNKEAIKHLKYQTFSDNVVISIPYFDREDDFLTNFNILSVYIRGFQLIMAAKGFFVRGGLSLGSYYADENIIFSKGLVNAYLLESQKAIYPRVVIDRNIIGKITGYEKISFQKLAIDKYIIFDWESVAFLNPFGIVNSSIGQIESAFASLEKQTEQPELQMLAGLTKSLTDLTLGMLKGPLTDETRTIEEIKQMIYEKMYQYYRNDRVYIKYLWLLDFIKWYQKDDSGKLKFETLSQFLTNQDKEDKSED